MANTFLTLQTIARAALPRLMENLVFPNLAYRDFSDTFQNLGDTIRVRKPARLIAQDFNEGSGVEYQDLKEDSISVTLDHIATVDARASAIETALNIDDLNRVFIEPAAVALAEKINADGLALYKDIPYVCGTAGATPDSLEAFAQARRVLNQNKASTEGRVAVWDAEADAKFATIPAIVNAEKSGSTQALRGGNIGRIFGIDNYMAQGVKKHATGIKTAMDVKVNGKVNAGATKLNIDAAVLTGKLVRGDVLLIGGKSYVVTADTQDAAANAISDVNVYPAMPEIADNAEVTLPGSHTANLAFNRLAFAYVTRPLMNPNGQGVESYVTSYNGISLRVTKGYDQKYKRSTYSMDVLYAYKTVYPELAVRIMG